MFPHRPACIDARTSCAAPWTRDALRPALAALLLALLAACQTTPRINPPGNVSNLPPGNASRDGPEAHPPANLEAVPDAVPEIEPLRVGGPNKPYEVGGHTYVPLTDDRAVTEKGLASWYGKKFHGHRTASGEAYNMYAMTAAHKTLPIPSYARVRNPANGQEVIVRVNDRGPFSPGRVIDLSYTAALKLGVLGGVQQVEITRITDDDIRTGAAFKHAPVTASASPAGAPAAVAAGAPATTTIAIGDLDRPAVVASLDGPRSGLFLRRHPKAPPLPPPEPTAPLAATSTTSLAPATTTAVDGTLIATAAPADLGSAAATDVVPAATGVVTSVSTQTLPAPDAAAALVSSRAAPALPVPAGVVLPPPSSASSSASSWVSSSASTPGRFAPATNGAAAPSAAMATAAASAVRPVATAPGILAGPAPAPTPATPGPGNAAATGAAGASATASHTYPDPRDERTHADTTAGAGYWIQLGAYKQRDGALEFQRRLVDEQPWLAPLLTVVIDHGLNKLQAGPYRSREDARNASERVRTALQLVPTIVEKR